MSDRVLPLAQRYLLGAPLGQGGGGRVFRARDLLTSTEVAVKLLSVDGGASAARVQLEVASLRALRIPGVVALLDHGVEAGVPWIVTDLVRGRPFPGRRRPVRWQHLRRPLASLLETLGRVHGAGVVHRDLKPANVLVDRAGEATVLDLGIAQLGAARAPGADGREAVVGTARYMAPERFDGAATAASDLFAVGVMLYEALAGAHPFCDDDDDASLVRWAARRGLRVPLDDRGVDAPAEVRALCHALLATQPADRPGSAEEALARLAPGSWGDPATLAPTERIVGPDRLVHLREDAVAELVARAPDSTEAQARELRRWVAAHDAVRRGPRVSVPREALDRLRNEREPATGAGLDALRRARARGAGVAREAGEVIGAARLLCEEGALGRAEHLLAEAVDALTTGDRGAASLDAALALWLEAATQSQDGRAIDRAVYALLRLDDGRLDAMTSLGRAWHASLLWTPDAVARIAAVPAQPTDGLEMARRNLRVGAARRRWGHEPDALRRVVAQEADEAEARGEIWRCRAALWRGRLAYAEGRFDEAADWYERAAAREPWRSARLNATLNAASARMEAFDFGRAVRLAERARAEAAACRHAFFEGRAEWIARTARDRAGEALEPDVGLVQAAEAVSAELGLLVATTEATVAWRRGDRATVASMAAVVRRAKGLTGEAMATMVLEMLAGAMGEGSRARGRAVVRRALAAGLPRLALEALALGFGDGSAGERERSLARGLAAEVPPAHRGLSLGVLSAEACLARLGAQG